jgi:hypothetical protein
MANVIFYSQLGYRPFIWRPVACYILARWLEEHGYTCQVIEFTHLFSPDELIETTKMFIDDDTMLLGVSSTMWATWNADLGQQSRVESIPENIKIAITELKKEFPKLKTQLGGPRAHDHIVGVDLFDFATTDAYGEDGLLKLMDELSKQTGVTKINRKKFDISSHRFIYKEHDCILPGETLPIEWGRGCIFQCPFCRSPNLGKKPGKDEKDISLMVDEFTEMYERFGTTAYYFIDETFNANSDRIERLGEVYNKLPFKLEFLAYNRADLLDAKPWTQDILHECGQRGALFGIETFHPDGAKLVNKPWSAKRGKDFLLELREKWPHTHIDVSLIAGLPNVPKEYLYETADWLMDSKLGFYWFMTLSMVENEKQGVWELNADDKGITWPSKKYPQYWEWGDMSFIKAYTMASELNRYVKTQSRWAMWGLGPLKTVGLDLMDCVNKSSAEIFEQTGDMYDHEDRLFEMYKAKLHKIAGR